MLCVVPKPRVVVRFPRPGTDSVVRTRSKCFKVTPAKASCEGPDVVYEDDDDDDDADTTGTTGAHNTGGSKLGLFSSIMSPEKQEYEFDPVHIWRKSPPP